MDNLYFTFWIQRHGKELFTELINLVSEQTTLPEVVQNPDSNVSKDEYLFHYFFVVYCIAALKYFGLSTNKISFILDLLMSNGLCEAFPPKKIFETHKEAIPIIQEFIKADLEAYTNK